MYQFYIKREQNYITSMSDLRTYNVLEGTVSDNMYFLDISYPNLFIIRKTTYDDSLIWVTSFTGTHTVKGFALDNSESNIYSIAELSQLAIFNLDTSKGALISVNSFSTLQSMNYDIKIFTQNDGSGLTFITNKSSSGKTNL